MKFIGFSLLVTGLVASSAFTQSKEYCGYQKAIEYQESRLAGFQNHVNQSFEFAKRNQGNSQDKSGEEITIPVVFHIVFSTPEQNLADEIIHSQIEVLNQDFRRQNPDTADLRPIFDGIKAATNINFVLASIDPNGNPTSGITRTSTSVSSFGSYNLYLGNFVDVEKVKSSSQGGKSPWNPNKYLNIWVCNMALNVSGEETLVFLAYGTPPVGLPNWPANMPNLVDGIVMQYQAIGVNNPNELIVDGDRYAVLGRMLTHEVGHYLGLRHIWGDGNCSQIDGIDDTPNALSASPYDCNKTKNTCLDNIVGTDLPDMVENFMDYSEEPCQNTFTQGQVDLINAVLENQRFSLVNNNTAYIQEIKPLEAKLYPVPACTELNVVTSEPINGTISVLDLNGAMISSQDANHSESNKLNVCDLKNGVYFVQIESNEFETKVLKFVKQ